MSDDSKALATSTPEDRAIAEIRERGAAVVAHRREIKELDKIIAGMSFGTVSGASFSPQTRWQIAKFCEITGAEPLTQVDILGGKPYLNANYWADNLVNQPLFLRYEQRDLSPSVEELLRAKARELSALADGLEGQEATRLRVRAYNHAEEADTIAIDRARWSPRATATVVIETTIYRFMNFAPLGKISSGEITDFENYVVPVTECNWAGGHGIVKIGSMDKKDPIGDANPGTTARSRSLRRCAAKAFSAWMGEYKERIEVAEKAIEAEYEIIVAGDEEAKVALPVPGGPQAVTFTNGEPEAMNPEEAEDLPIEGVDVEPVAVEPKKKKAKKAPAPAQAPAPAEPVPFDASDARKALFATLRDAGVSNEDRKGWAVSNGLPESTSLWMKADYDNAMEILIAPTREKVLSGCEALEMDLADLCLEVLGQDTAKYLKDWNALAVRLQDEMDGADL